MNSLLGRTKRKVSATLPASSATQSSHVNGERSAEMNLKRKSTHLPFGSELSLSLQVPKQL